MFRNERCDAPLHSHTAVFSDAAALIEANALYWECENWTSVAEPYVGQSAAGIREAASSNL
jgi:hypothetical protein